MPNFRRESIIEAPLEDVWAFHSTIDGLTRLTPAMAGLRIDDLRVPDGGDTLVEGTEMDLSAGPIPGGPRQSFTAVIVQRYEKEEEAAFVDEMRDGPMKTWRHTHRFVQTAEETRLIDDITYETGRGAPIDRLFRVGLRAAFWDRHRRTREMLGGT